MSRCFYALWPDPATREEISAAAERIPHHGRPVAPSNYHLTLVFLGTISHVQIADLMQETSRVQACPFSLALGHAGWWNGPRVLWLAPELCPEPLLQLVTRLSGLARQQGIRLEERPYRPHLSIARQVRTFPGPDSLEPICWKISDFCLLRSKSLKTGVVYELLASWPLTAAASV